MKQICMLLMLAVSLPAYCQTYFSEGMEWVVKTTSTDRPEPTQSYNVFTIEKCEDDNAPALGIFQKKKDSTDKPKLNVYVMTEGDKVYFKLPDSNVRNWYLMYDFGLKPGDGCFFYTPFTNYPNVEPRRTYLKCLSVDKEEEGDWEVMTLEEYIEFEGEFIKQDKTGKWFIGLGSANGVTDNNSFNKDGCSSHLIEASLNGEVIYENTAAGVAEAEVAATLQIKVDGLDVYVSGIDKADEAILYTEGGMVCGRYDLQPGHTAHLRLPAQGVYILKTSAGTTKILA